MPRSRAFSGRHPTPVQSSPDTTNVSYDVLAGCILWLPQKEDIDGRSISVGIDDGCFNHPVAVLSVDPVEKKAAVLIITSFDGQDLRERHPRNSRFRGYYLPIYPSAPHPDSGTLLRLNGNRELRKKSYINTKVQHNVDLAVLVKYDQRGGEYKLEQESYALLTLHANSIPPTSHSRRRRGLPDPCSQPLVPSSVPSTRPHAIADPTSGTFPGSYGAVGTRSPLRPIQPIFPPSHLTPYQIRGMRREWGISYRDSCDNERSPLLPYASQPSPSDPGPSSPPITTFAAYLLRLCFLGALGYCGYRLFTTGKLAWRGLRAEFSRCREEPQLMYFLNRPQTQLWRLGAHFQGYINRLLPGGFSEYLGGAQTQLWRLWAHCQGYINRLLRAGFSGYLEGTQTQLWCLGAHFQGYTSHLSANLHECSLWNSMHLLPYSLLPNNFADMISVYLEKS